MLHNLAVITGASSGLGKALAYCLMVDHWRIFNLSKEPPDDREHEEAKGIHFIPCDVTDSASIAQATASLQPMDIRVLINCAGVNEINWLEHVSQEDWDQVLATNARAIMLMTQAFLPQLSATKGTVLNIISNASHMPMTASIAYNASKAAAHIMTLQMARELTKQRGITVFGISPNKLRGTGMSRYIEERVLEVRGWTADYAAQYQKNALVTGEETDPWELAKLVAYLLRDKNHHKYLSGCVLPYGA